MKHHTFNTLGASSIFTKTAQETSGDYAEMEATLPACSKEPIRHILPKQTIELEALDGKLGIILPDRRLIIKPGSAFEIPKNMEHAFYNADEKPVRFKSKLSPALHTEWLSNEIGAVTQRKQSKWMAVLERSYIMSQINGEYYRSDIPMAIHTWFSPLLLRIARFFDVHKRVKPVY